MERLEQQLQLTAQYRATAEEFGIPAAISFFECELVRLHQVLAGRDPEATIPAVQS